VYPVSLLKEVTLDMNAIDTLLEKGNFLHHAYLLEGNKESLIPLLCDAIESKLNMSVRGNQDCLIQEFESFTIEDSRMLKMRAYTKSAYGGKQLFIISFHSITVEAQNSLLKLLEEPAENTHFFLITSNSEILLPTVLSRLYLLKERRETRTGEVSAVSFLRADFAQRLSLVQNIIEKKDKQEAISLLNGIQSYLYKRADLRTISSEEISSLQEMQKMHSYLSLRSASIKIILEYLTLTAPIFGGERRGKI